VSANVNLTDWCAQFAADLMGQESRATEMFLAHGHTVEVHHLDGSRTRIGDGVATARVTVTREGEKVTIRGEALCSPIQDWPTFWQSLTPAEVRDALRAAPRVAGPWTEDAPGDWWRDAVNSVNADGCANVDEDFAWSAYWSLDETERGSEDSADAAKSAADAALRQAGWVLL
jgi:hypothetical protein